MKSFSTTNSWQKKLSSISINKFPFAVNMEEELLTVQRVIYDAIKSTDADAGSFPITKESRQSCKKACQTEASSNK